MLLISYNFPENKTPILNKDLWTLLNKQKNEIN